MRISIIGTGEVGGTLTRRLTRLGHAVGQIGSDALDSCECEATGRIRLLLTFAGVAPPPAD
jgi:predicted dinucleotide-binding enzyme